MSLNGWSNIIKLTIDSSKIDEDLTDFPILVVLSSNAGINSFDATNVFNELSTASGSYINRKKVAISYEIDDNDCLLPVEIELWDDTTSSGNNQAWLWTKVPVISSGTDTELCFYYDADHVDNIIYVGDTGSVAAQNVWDNNFVGVWHLSQDPSGGSDCIKDSTMRINYGTPSGIMDSDDLIDGKIGKSLDFDGSDDAIDLGTSSDYDVDSFTLEAIISNTGTIVDEDYAGILSSYALGLYSQHYGLRNYYNYSSFYYDDGTAWDAVHGTTDTISGTYYVVGTLLSNTLATIYVNGQVENTDTSSIPESITLTDRLYIGRDGDRAAPGNQSWQGMIDEVRISNINRSSAWVKATYYSNWDELITYSNPYWCEGYVEVGGTRTSGIPIFLHRSDNGAFVGSAVTSGIDGTFSIPTTYSGYHYIVAHYIDDTYNALVYDWLLPTIS